MRYPIKTMSQLPLILKAFRKLKGLTQADMGEKLGVTQQTYASFEGTPATATLERLFKVLRLLDVEILLDQVSLDAPNNGSKLTVTHAKKSRESVKNVRQKRSRSAGNVIIQKAKVSDIVKTNHKIVPERKKEEW